MRLTGQDLPDIMAGPDAAVLPGRPVAEAGRLETNMMCCSKEKLLKGAQIVVFWKPEQHTSSCFIITHHILPHTSTYTSSYFNSLDPTSLSYFAIFQHISPYFNKIQCISP